MRDEESSADASGEDETTAVGIVVQDGPAPAWHPHLEFAWGPEVNPAPSLPFGRWKTGKAA